MAWEHNALNECSALPYLISYPCSSTTTSIDSLVLDCPQCLALKVCVHNIAVIILTHVRCLVGTPKYLANAMKSKGLQRLRWYCQVCEKQCRDENGFKCHATSEGHLRQMLVVGENAGRHISDFSSTFQSEFVTLLSRRYVLIVYH